MSTLQWEIDTDETVENQAEKTDNDWRSLLKAFGGILFFALLALVWLELAEKPERVYHVFAWNFYEQGAGGLQSYRGTFLSLSEAKTAADTLAEDYRQIVVEDNARMKQAAIYVAADGSGNPAYNRWWEEDTPFWKISERERASLLENLGASTK